MHIHTFQQIWIVKNNIQMSCNSQQVQGDTCLLPKDVWFLNDSLCDVKCCNVIMLGWTVMLLFSCHCYILQNFLI
jgi:hypothetical protein